MIETITRLHGEHIEKTKMIMAQVRHAIKHSMTVYKMVEKNVK